MLIKRTIKVGFIFALSIVASLIYTILNFVSQSARKRREVLASKIEQLTDDAVRDLRCDARRKRVFIPSTNINLHVVEAGPSDGKLVILLHGYPENWHSWSEIIPSLVESGYLVVAPDLRGFNLSDKPSSIKDYNIKLITDDVLGLIKYYERVQAHAILAHDWGGIIAYNFALTYPQSVKKLVVMNAPHPMIWIRTIFNDWSQFLSSWYIFFYFIPVLPDNFYVYDPVTALSGMFKLKRKEYSKKDLDILACGIAQRGSITAMLSYYRNFSWNYILRKHFTGKENNNILCPTLVVWGENDVALIKKTADCREFAKEFSLKYVPNCSHFILKDAPEIVLKNAIPFLEN